jgi:hypothetical protein
MTMLIDAATGSNEFEEPLRKLGIPVDVTHLDFGDFVFNGRGEGGENLYIGIEFKKLGEFIGSLRSKRLQGHQLIGLTKDFDRRYLLIEGEFHSDKQGRATAFRGKGKPRPLPGAGNAVALEQEVINLQTRGGCWVKETTTRRNSLRFLEAVYRYWTDKDLDEHKSHMAVYAPDLDKGLLTPTSDFRRMVCLFIPNIGLQVSKAVEDRCMVNGRPSVRKMLSLDAQEWANLLTTSKGKTRRLGEARATQIMGFLDSLR